MPFKFLRKVKIKFLKLSQVLENLEIKMETEEAALDAEHKKKKEKKLIEEMSTMHELNVKEKENLSNEHTKQKELIETMIKACVRSIPPPSH
jgi:hypothetical protein